MSYSIYPINPYSLNLPVILFGIGYEENQPHVQRAEGFPFSQLFFCRKGDGILRVDGEEYTIPEGSFFFLEADFPHEYYGVSQSWELTWIAFAGEFCRPLLKELGFGTHTIGQIREVQKTEMLCNKMFQILQKEDPTARVDASVVLYEMIAEVYRMQKIECADTKKENQTLRNVKDYIDQNYAKELTLEELAGVGQISPQYLCRLFRRYLELRPFEYVTLRRIQQAKLLLMDHSIPIAEVADRVGFHDCSYFGRIFRKQEKVSPSQFRGME